MHTPARIVLRLAPVLLMWNAAAAQAENDIRLTVENGRIVTNTADTPGERIFNATLGVEGPNIAVEPGFDCEPGTFGVPGGVAFRVHGPLLEWTGTKCEPAVDGERLSISLTSLGDVLTPTEEGVVDGFGVPVSVEGRWRPNFTFTLTEPAGDGAYLVQLTLVSTAESTNPASESEPFWIIIDQRARPQETVRVRSWVQRFVMTRCTPDFNDDGAVDVADLFGYINAWLLKSDTADRNADDAIDIADLFGYINEWLARC